MSYEWFDVRCTCREYLTPYGVGNEDVCNMPYAGMFSSLAVRQTFRDPINLTIG